MLPSFLHVQEQVQLNVALQTEIVRFTVLGIQKAIRDVEESMAEQERNSTGGTSFFVSAHSTLSVWRNCEGFHLIFGLLSTLQHPRRTGEAFSFMLNDDGRDSESILRYVFRFSRFCSVQTPNATIVHLKQ